MIRYYTIKNRILGNGERVEKIVELADGSIGRILESNLPAGEVEPASSSSFRPITGRALSKIVNKAFKAKPLDRRTHGSSDFLPFSFLSKGIRCGAPVCLILRQYAEASAEELLKNIDSGEYKTNRLSKLLNIPNPEEFWVGQTSVSVALRDVEGLRARLIDHIKSKPLAVGTGFLVGQNHILTNNHVLPSVKHAEEYIIRFRYEIDLQGRELDAVDYALDSTFFYTNEEGLDYTLAKVLSLPQAEQKRKALPFSEAGNNFGWLQMLRAEDGAVATPYIPTLERTQLFKEWLEQMGVLGDNLKSEPGIPGEFDANSFAHENQWARDLRKDLDYQDSLDPEVKAWLKRRGINGQNVSLIQHPQGGRKEVVLYSNQVQAIYKDWIQYQTDAEPGSSGSPLFNDQWQLVGLHHSAVIGTRDTEVEASRLVDNLLALLPVDWRESIQSSRQERQQVKVIGYLGTRICRVLEDLEKKLQETEDLELRNFLADYVDHPKRGRIFVSAGQKRKLTADLEEKAEFESEVLFKLGDRIVEAVRSQDANLKVIHIQAQKDISERTGSAAEDVDAAITWLQSQGEYRPGDVAIEIILDTASEQAIAAYADRAQSDRALDPKETRGAKVCYLWNQAERKFNAELLLREFWQHAQKVNQTEHGQASEFPNLGTQPDITFGSIRFCADVSMPSLVLYAGYLTSEKDCRLFQDKYLDELAAGVAKGLIKWTNALSPNISRGDVLGDALEQDLL
ncbi:MAG: trypsin-like peptidase domain-containing protein [Cyanobacteria bacterium P01_D01_bin.1]